MDLHNLCISGLDRVEPDPREDYRESILKVNNLDMSSLRNSKSLSASEKSPEVTYPTTETETANVNEEEQLVKKLKSLDISIFTCEICKSQYKNKGNLTNHINKKHPSTENTQSKPESLVSGNVCPHCDQPFGNKGALEKHIRTKHMTCSVCKSIYKTPDEMAVCRSSHTTCSICHYDAKFPSTLKRHMESHK